MARQAKYKYTVDGDLVKEIEITLQDGRKINIEIHGRVLGEETLYLPKHKPKEFGHKQMFLAREEEYDVYLPQEGVVTIRTSEGHKPLLWIGRRERK